MTEVFKEARTALIEKKLKHYRLSRLEYEQIKVHLKREPEDIEWALFSALWSEHCSYKSSKVHLRKLFSKHPRVVQGPGENAGVIDLGEGERVAFKMESHNHPSFIEPTQGAATGVGGILRDIFTMGARPMASMDYLCFGEPDHPLTPRLVAGVVKGIGGYGNCVGVATVGGQTTFHKRYNNNILVNAFNLGLFRPGEEIFYGRASGTGNLIVYVGARTGRDGVHGAAMASESFDEDIEKKKPNVQIGDPFLEKLLIEACLEVMKEKLVVGIQDMGAAGLTSSTFEMAARAESGLKLDLKKVPLREPDITPEEILLSESQERMVMIVEPKNLKRVEAIFKRWDLDCSVIGEITDTKMVEIYWGDKALTKLSHEPLVEKAPVYERPFQTPNMKASTPINAPDPESLEKTLAVMLQTTELSSRDWITRQYDQRVGAKTISACEDSVALLRLPDSGRVIGMTTGCRPLLMEWHPEIGAKDAIVLPALQMAVRGVKALACTDCLNFGNPEKPEIMGEFVAALHGMDSACRALDIPIISGNVSLYNETQGQNIIGTPSTGLVGLSVLKPIKSLSEKYIGPIGEFSEEGLELYLVGTKDESTWLGEYAELILRSKTQGGPKIVLDDVVALQKVFLKLAEFGVVSKVIARAGLLTTLAKMCNQGIGAKIDYFERKRGLVEFLFAERFYSSIWAIRPSDATKLNSIISENESHVMMQKIGQTGGRELLINHYFKMNVDSVLKTYNQSLGGLVEIMA